MLAMDQPGWLNGKATRAVNFQSPLSEGIVNSEYSIVAHADGEVHAEAG